MTQMQGIVSILDSGNPNTTTKAAASLRRTLSADMSSKRWMAENGPGLKKVGSSEQIAINSHSDEEEDECEMTGNGNGPEKNPSRIDIWTAIMSQKAQDESGKLPPPYIHPLVKKSASSLSEKSLKICTESLGSETGSDGFSSSDEDENKIHEIQEEYEDVSKEAEGKEHNNNNYYNNNNTDKVVRPTYLTTKKAQQAGSFPPPLASLATAQTDGPSLHMHSYRVDGRLVLEAVSVPQQKYFEAQRHDGRFLLTLINNPNGPQPGINDLDIKTRPGYDLENGPNDKKTGILKPTVTIKRMIERDNENPGWSRKVKVVEEEEEASPTLIFTQSFPPRSTGLPPLPPPPPPAATMVNSYQYFWREKPTVASVIGPLITQDRPPTKTMDRILLRGNKADCFLPPLKRCEEPRRSVLMWEPFCIATS